jgi:hypothetical protein
MCQINALSYTAVDLICSSSRGLVHSVYNKTVNLSCGEALLSLQAQGTAASPLTLETSCAPEELSRLSFRPGMAVSFLSDGLYVEDTYFDFLHAQRWDARISHVLPARSPTDLSFLLDCLRGILPKGGFSDLMLPGGNNWSSFPCAVEAAKILAAARRSLSQQNWPQAARQLSSLVGLGEGLTPSGDDFLYGLLAACSLAVSPVSNSLGQALRSLLPACLNKTNLISAGFLRCAVEGLFSRPVLALAQGTCLSDAQTAFASIGHSSGADTLSGIIFLFSVL